MSWDERDANMLNDIRTILGEVLREIRDMREQIKPLFEPQVIADPPWGSGSEYLRDMPERLKDFEDDNEFRAADTDRFQAPQQSAPQHSGLGPDSRL